MSRYLSVLINSTDREIKFYAVYEMVIKTGVNLSVKFALFFISR